MTEDRGSAPEPGRAWLPGLVQREIVLVVVLVAAAVVLFGVTRSLAEWSASTEEATAAALFERGQAMVAGGEVAAGIVALRGAVSRDRLNATFALALVRALTDGVSSEEAAAEARRLLMQLREREPDRPEINFRLARLAAGVANVEDATRYYNHAMYGLAPDSPEYDRRRIRVELATLLLDHDDRSHALAELFALAPDVPDAAPDRIELGHLFLRAGEPRAGLAQYTAALRAEPQNASASAGAGEAAFALGSFAQAERYLQDAIRQGAVDGEARARLDTVRVVRSLHPLSAGLVSSERVRRLRAGLDWAAARLLACAGSSQTTAATADPMVDRLTAMRRRSLAELRESDALDEGVALIAAGVDEIRLRCPEREALEDAWQAIAGSVGAAPR